MKKALAQFDQSWQGELVSAELKVNNIESSVQISAREYTSVVLGGAAQKTILFVDDSDFSRAQAALAQITNNQSSSFSAEPVIKNYFRRVVILSVLGIIMLPVVFNMLASLNLIGLLKGNYSATKKIFGSLVFCLCWIGVTLEVLAILR